MYVRKSVVGGCLPIHAFLFISNLKSPGGSCLAFWFFWQAGWTGKLASSQNFTGCKFLCYEKLIYTSYAFPRTDAYIIARKKLKLANLYNHDSNQIILLKKEVKRLRNSYKNLFKIYDIFIFIAPAHVCFFFVISPVYLKINLVWPSFRKFYIYSTRF